MATSRQRRLVLQITKGGDAGAASGAAIMAKRNHLLSVLSVGCTMLIASPCWAATVERTQGDLSINQGQGFRPIKSRINANVGDTVMVGPGGAATVVYDDGCKVNVQPGAVATIAPISPCASGSNAQAPPWECHPDQTHDCGWTAGTTAFLALFLADIGVISYLISQVHGQPSAPSPASP